MSEFVDGRRTHSASSAEVSPLMDLNTAIAEKLQEDIRFLFAKNVTRSG